MPLFSKMICLVGDNPLPIWSGIQQFMPTFNETKTLEVKPVVVLVYSEETTEVAGHICGQLEIERQQRVHEIGCVVEPRGKVSNAYEPEAMRSTLKLLGDISGCALNYTGGSKVMSAYFLHEWMTRCKTDRAFYLEERKGLFHFDSGTPRKLDIPNERALNIATLEKLHGAEKHLSRTEVPCDLNECKRFYDHHKKGILAPLKKRLGGYADDKLQVFFEKQVEASGGWNLTGDWGDVLQLVSEPIRTQWSNEPLYTDGPKPQLNPALKEQFRFAVKNEWLEWLVALLLKDIIPNADVVVGQSFKIEGQEFEADVLAVHKNRLYYFSVTTQESKPACTEKMIEAIHRSRQLGGGLARSCTVSLANTFFDDRTSKHVDTVPAIRESLTGKKEVGNHTIFGKKHVETWLKADYAQDLHDFIHK